ncbi:MAG: fimbrillin family protein [Bacteroidales bacterium]
MKSIKTIQNFMLLLMLAAGVAGCRKEECTATEGNATQGIQLSISVTDGGYVSSYPKTRATENGYTTTFNAGDQIGLYAVVDNTIVAQNVCLTAADNGKGGVSWTGNAYYEGATAKYFAYYPYKATVNGTPAPTASTAVNFFADVTTKWTPATNQSSYAGYTASDLMTGKGNLSRLADGTYTLAFTMTHAMALVVIEIPTIKYTFTNTTPAIPNYYIVPPNTTFYGFMPYSPSVGGYRYLVKPSVSGAADLYGSYTAANGNTKEYAVSPNIAAASYACYKVDDANVIEKTHTLQTGDFFMKDGTLVSKDVTTLTTAQQAACVGIVYWVGGITNDDALLKKDHSNCTHGLVVALHDAHKSLDWSVNAESVNAWTNAAERKDKQVNITVDNKMQGYSNTVALTAYNNESSNVQKNDSLKVLPIVAIAEYAKNHPAPANSSGWYLPSIMELVYICSGQGNGIFGVEGRDMLNTQFNKVGGTVFTAHPQYCASSSEDGDNINNALVMDFNGANQARDKYHANEWYKFLVRAIFAF